MRAPPHPSRSPSGRGAPPPQGGDKKWLLNGAILISEIFFKSVKSMLTSSSKPNPKPRLFLRLSQTRRRWRQVPYHHWSAKLGPNHLGQ